MFRFLMGIAGIELRHVAQRAAMTAFLLIFAGLFLAGAVLALLVAGFVVLAEIYGPAGAALIIAGICLFLALIFLLIVYVRTRRRSRPVGYGALGSLAPPPPPPNVFGQGAAGQAPQTPAAPASPSSSTVLAVAAGAALLGLILGRRL
ncbi:phage holin family protein [Ancylobacter pratisalsi]|uniref:Uncharacterized protein n=1 Tax=Ancylobacter pratisalsi TaxID=1745854 RepID=A0A6P1YQ73_9HYPH|nr:phage holin family protein [Ancylobacter pratisalsi]QIB33874.1 hypothetical protein G3A50_09250 [Ancylobacter pratisalsi]